LNQNNGRVAAKSYLTGGRGTIVIITAEKCSKIHSKCHMQIQLNLNAKKRLKQDVQYM